MPGIRARRDSKALEPKLNALASIPCAFRTSAAAPSICARDLLTLSDWRDVDPSASGAGAWPRLQLRRRRAIHANLLDRAALHRSAHRCASAGHPEGRLILCVAVIVTDVAHNSWFALHYPIRMDLYLSQTVFLLFVAFTVRTPGVEPRAGAPCWA